VALQLPQGENLFAYLTDWIDSSVKIMQGACQDVFDAERQSIAGPGRALAA
jgi:hypothetical protein